MLRAAGGGIASLFGRGGPAVVAQTGDYTAAQVTNAADKASASTQLFTGVLSTASTLVGSGGVTGQVNIGATSGPGSTSGIQFYVGAAGPALGRNAANGLTCSSIFTAPGAILNPITSGALPTVSPSSTTALQVSTARDVFLMQICTFNPSAGAAATCKVELSPDNSTYSTLITVTVPAGVVFDGGIPPISFQVPAGWWVKFTTTNATLGTGTYY